MDHCLYFFSLAQSGFGVDFTLGGVEVVRRESVEGGNDPKDDQFAVVCGLHLLEFLLGHDLENTGHQTCIHTYQKMKKNEEEEEKERKKNEKRE